MIIKTPFGVGLNVNHIVRVDVRVDRGLWALQYRRFHDDSPNPSDPVWRAFVDLNLVHPGEHGFVSEYLCEPTTKDNAQKIAGEFCNKINNYINYRVAVFE